MCTLQIGKNATWHWQWALHWQYHSELTVKECLRLLAIVNQVVSMVSTTLIGLKTLLLWYARQHTILLIWNMYFPRYELLSSLNFGKFQTDVMHLSSPCNKQRWTQKHPGSQHSRVFRFINTTPQLGRLGCPSTPTAKCNGFLSS